MAVNVGKYPHRQHFYCMDETDKPGTAYVGDKLYIMNTGIHEVWNGEDWVEYFQPRFAPEEEVVEE